MFIPRATEKAYSELTKNTYVFSVPTNLSKQAIAKAISEEFKVTVTGVKTLVRNGRPKRFSRGKHAYPGTTLTADKKIAYITVKAGDKIPVFEEQTTDTTSEKETKKATTAKEGDK